MRLWHYHIAGFKSHHDEAFDLNVRVDHSDRKKVLVTSLTTLQLLMQKKFCYEKNPLRAMEHFYVFSAERKQRVS